MTTIVFNSGILTIATESWCATARNDVTVAHPEVVQVHVLNAPSSKIGQCNLPMTMAEFLALIADGGKIVDLRGLQEVARPATRTASFMPPDATIAEVENWMAEQRR